MSAREEAIEALLLDGNQHNYCWWLDVLDRTDHSPAVLLAFDARHAVEDIMHRAGSYSEISLEAAQLLVEGWVPGQKVVRL